MDLSPLLGVRGQRNVPMLILTINQLILTVLGSGFSLLRIIIFLSSVSVLLCICIVCQSINFSNDPPTMRGGRSGGQVAATSGPKVTPPSGPWQQAEHLSVNASII